MSARAQITNALLDGGLGIGSAGAAADLVVEAIRKMTLKEVAELRPDLAAEFAVARELAATRGAYIIATSRARAVDGRSVTVRVVVSDDEERGRAS